MESTAKFAFDKLVKFYQLACLLRYYDEDSSKWIQPALKFYVEMLGNSQENALKIAPTLEEVNNLLAWDF
jgi:hypothetical protein